jgi:protein-disulfide isomerase
MEWIATGALIVCALVVSISYAYRTFFSGNSGSERVESSAFVGWSEAQRVGRAVAGDSTSQTTMVVFADFQCPACRGYHERVITRALEKHASVLRVLYVHFPLEYHDQAMPAARATECLDSSVDLRAWIDLLYQQQDSLGAKSYGRFAQEVGLIDTTVFVRCINGATPFARIEAGLRLGSEGGVRGTPAVVIDGMLYADPPQLSTIDTHVAQRSRAVK